MQSAVMIKSFLVIVLLIALSSCGANAPMGEAAAPGEFSAQLMAMESTPQPRMLRESSDEAPSRQRPEEPSGETRMVAYSATLSLSVKDTEETKKALLAQLKSSKGFIIREISKSITVRVPAENMDEFINYSRTLGEVEGESKTGTDITDQYRDNVIRLDNLRQVRARYLALLEKASGVSDILNIERELERISAHIEMLEGRIKYSEQSVAFSQVTVDFKEKTKPSRPGPIGWIFYGLYHGIKWLFIWN
ncbi:MAG: DUF4349 domain-containing protein [Chitinispirillia bacterium]|nr:DUF4349 domain-containing protein [Chitinispirillia bacterium]